jgi:hypothetical protein
MSFDSPYSWHRVSPENRTQPPAWEEVHPALRAVVNVVLIDATSGIVLALRMCTYWTVKQSRLLELEGPRRFRGRVRQIAKGSQSGRVNRSQAGLNARQLGTQTHLRHTAWKL